MALDNYIITDYNSNIMSGQHHLNVEKSLALASALFPFEKWIPHGEGIFVAKSRLTGSHKEQAKLYREIADVRILTGRGSVAYFLPERLDDREIAKAEEPHSMHADTVIDGVIVEIKTVSGNRATLGKSFRRGYKQGRSFARPGCGRGGYFGLSPAAASPNGILNILHYRQFVNKPHCLT